jgi:hypothetical protein
MGFISRLNSLLFTGVPVILWSGIAMAQSDDLCFMQTSSGQWISLSEFCGKSGDKAVSDFMWDENNYDPNFVGKVDGGGWSVVLGAPHPFKYPDGAIMYPDGTVRKDGVATSRITLGPDGRSRVEFLEPDGSVSKPDSEQKKD